MSAILSPCGEYRYTLARPPETLLPERGTALFVMLNPSTADASLDDPTIRRCRGFARTWGCAGLVVANLYALRATNPKALWMHQDPIGPQNDQHLQHLAGEFTDVICAWGRNAEDVRVAVVVDILTRAGARLWCLGTNAYGSPKHPLYVRADQALIEWSMK